MERDLRLVLRRRFDLAALHGGCGYAGVTVCVGRERCRGCVWLRVMIVSHIIGSIWLMFVNLAS